MKTISTKKKSKAKKHHQKRVTAKDRLDSLKKFVRLCMDMLGDHTKPEIAAKSTLCLQTVYRLAEGDISLCMRVNTLMCIGYAAGLKLDLVDGEALVTLIK